MTHNDIINMGANRELFWDDYLLDLSPETGEKFAEQFVDKTTSLFHLEEPQKKEIIMRLDKSWEGKVCGYMHCFFDGSKYRLYYRASNGFSGEKLNKKASICLLLSDDGINWERPDLGLFEFEGNRNNNIVFLAEELDNFFIFKDENPACDPAALYKAVAQGPKSKEFPSGGLQAYFSSDGISWPKTPAHKLKGLSGNSKEHFFDSLNTAHWDKKLNKYRLYFRGFHGEGRFRDIRLALSDDFINWEDESLISVSAISGAALPDEQLYTNGILPYYRSPDMIAGFPVRYVERKWEPMFEQFPHKKWRLEKIERFGESRLGTALTDGLFLMSRDGLNFKRHDMAFLKPGIFREYNWVYGDCYQSWGLLETDADDPAAPREISFFVGEDYTSRPIGIRRYTIRLDGFACMQSGGSDVTVITKPFTFEGNTLTLNMSTSAAGFVSVEFLDAEKAPIPGFSGNDAYKLFGDDISIKALFKRGNGTSGHECSLDLSAIEGKVVRIRFILREAKLYSMQFVREEK